MSCGEGRLIHRRLERYLDTQAPLRSLAPDERAAWRDEARQHLLEMIARYETVFHNAQHPSALRFRILPEP